MSTEPKYWQEHGVVLEIGSNVPLLLNQGHRAWVILAGGVDVFSVELAGGQPAGARNHLFRVSEGQLLLELEGPAGQGQGLMAVALPKTSLCELTRARLQYLSRQPEGAGIIRNLLERWVSEVSQSLAGARPLPLDNLILKPGDEAALSPGQVAIPGHEVLWVRQQEGATKFLSLADLPSLSGPALFPLTQFTWIEAEQETQLRAMTTAEFLQQDPAWQGLQEFHRLVLAYLSCERCHFLLDEARGLDEEVRSSEDLLAGSFARLASVLKPEEGLEGTEGQSPLLAACHLVGEAMGVAVQSPPADKYREQQGYNIREIARISRFRVRKVKLRGDWWRRDNGPLLGFSAAGAHPVALIPASPKSYKLHDPTRRIVAELTSEVAAGLSPTAYQFYRPFLNQPLTALNLMRFGPEGHGERPLHGAAHGGCRRNFGTSDADCHRPVI
jgi:hypothetical protein